MAREPLSMSPNYLAVVRGVRDLHRLSIEGQDEAPEADAIRDATDAPWEALTEVERRRIRGLSEDLYSISNPDERSDRPSDPKVQSNLIDVLIARKSGQWDRALDVLRKWGQYIPPSVLSCLRGSIWLESGDPETASLFYAHASHLEPHNGNYLALVLHSLDLAGSEEALERAEGILARDESYPPAVIAYASEIVLMASLSAHEADASRERLRLISVLERSLARLEAGDEEDFDRAIYVMTVGLLGCAHEFLGQTQAAVECFSRGLQVEPSNEALLIARGILLYGTSPLAITDFERAAGRDCHDVWPYYYLAHSYVLSNRFEECRAMCERAALAPASPSVRSELAEWKAISQSELGFPADLVRASFEDSLRHDPSNDRSRRNFSLFEATERPSQSTRWETRSAAAVQASGLTARRLEGITARSLAPEMAA